MKRYTKDQRLFIAEQCFVKSDSLASIVRIKCGRNSDLTSSIVIRLVKKFREAAYI